MPHKSSLYEISFHKQPQLTIVQQQRAHYLHPVTEYLTPFNWPPSSLLLLSQYFTYIYKNILRQRWKTGKYYKAKRSNDHKPIKINWTLSGKNDDISVFPPNVKLRCVKGLSADCVLCVMNRVVISVVMGNRQPWRRQRHLGEPELWKKTGHCDIVKKWGNTFLPFGFLVAWISW